jgi:hypothetical protein
MKGYVYFITSEPDQYVKIGWSLKNPVGRMRELQTGCPEVLRLMAYFPGSLEEERRLHRTFAELHYRGEWFSLQYKLLDLVRYLSDGWPRETESCAGRRRFEDSVWDIILGGYEHPDMPPEYLAAYRASANGEIWHFMHPEFA